MSRRRASANQKTAAESAQREPLSTRLDRAAEELIEKHGTAEEALKTVFASISPENVSSFPDRYEFGFVIRPLLELQEKSREYIRDHLLPSLADFNKWAKLREEPQRFESELNETLRRIDQHMRSAFYLLPKPKGRSLVNWKRDRKIYEESLKHRRSKTYSAAYLARRIKQKFGYELTRQRIDGILKQMKKFETKVLRAYFAYLFEAERAPSFADLEVPQQN